MNTCKYIIFFISIAVLSALGGCKESEIHFSHAKHMERGLSDCNTCHAYKEDLAPKWPKMPKCLTCHMKNFDTNNPRSCLLCHTKPGMKIKVKHNIPKKYRDLKFTHKVHLENNVACNKCHSSIEKSDTITTDLLPDMYRNCVPCHKERGADKIACDVCHKHIKKNRMPLYHEERWVNHEDPRWMLKHGSEFYYNKNYCKRCHSDQNWCVNCHQIQKPKSHNNAWRRRTHGFAASWERKKCMACHQEDFCVRCHTNTTPLSHTNPCWRLCQRGKNKSVSRHCLNCHYSISMVECRVCHPRPEHPSAIDSPHPPFSGNCYQSGCHPAGRPGAAPHSIPPDMTNKCKVCHK